MTKPKAKRPSEEEETLPPRDERPQAIWHDPGTCVSPERIDATIERIFNDGPRLGVPTLAKSEAA